jgi:hypothetical protein
MFSLIAPQTPHQLCLTYIEQPCQDKKIILSFFKESEFATNAREAFDEDNHKAYRPFWANSRENEGFWV